MEIDAETIFNMLKEAETLGAYKLLNWIAEAWEKEATNEDLAEWFSQVLIELRQRLSVEFAFNYGYLPLLKRIVETRLKEKAKVKPT